MNKCTHLSTRKILFTTYQSIYKAMKTILFIVLCLNSITVYAQKNKKQNRDQINSALTIPLNADNWDFPEGKVEFAEVDSRPSMKISPNGVQVILKNTEFANGTIEFDMIPNDPYFATIYFRWQTPKDNECFYLRTDQNRDSTATDAVQYAPSVSGVNFWDMLGHFQGSAYFWKDGWNHVKIVVSGFQMRAYVNDMARPVIEVSRLEGNTSKGTIAFEGDCVVSNVVIKKDQIENLSPLPGADLTNHDPRYIRRWLVNKPVETPKGIDFSVDLMPKPEDSWEVINSERMGLINLTRKFGGHQGMRKIVWLKVNIESKTAQKKKISLGFSDEVWVFLNGRHLYVDKNLYGSPIMKEPVGRLSLENSSFEIPFKEGKNEILIGVANYFFGWGIVARLENMYGISVIK